MSSGKATFYRLAREWHGYLSAVAFVSLIFFAGTGITLNHPEWFARTHRPQETVQLHLAPHLIKAALSSTAPTESLARVVGARAHVLGAFSSGDVDGDQALIHFEGVAGSSDVSIDLLTGAGEVDSTRADVALMLNDLHRGKNAGATWKVTIDAIAALVLALSVVGFALFLSLRVRRLTSLVLVGAGAVTLVAVAALAIF
ncbi:MAG: PepSY-associated TM helix domain-containing protein [Terricaulis sp.]